MVAIEKLSAILRDTARRLERTSGLGDKTAQYLNQHPADMLGAEDYANVMTGMNSGLTPGHGMARVGEFEI